MSATPTGESIRRQRVIYVPTSYVLKLLSRGLVCDGRIRMPEPLGLPATARVLTVHNSWERDAFAMVVQDESFDAVPDGMMLPEMQVQWGYVDFALELP